MVCRPCTAWGLNSRHRKWPPLFSTCTVANLATPVMMAASLHGAQAQSALAAKMLQRINIALILDTITATACSCQEPVTQAAAHPVSLLKCSVDVSDVADPKGDGVAVLGGALYRQLLSIALHPAQQLPACQGVCQPAWWPRRFLTRD